MDKLTPQQRYERKAIVPIALKLNRNTDADIISRLALENNRQGWIKQVIRDRIAAERGE